MHLPNGVTEFAIKQAVNYLTKDPEKNLPKLMDWVDKIAGENLKTSAETCAPPSKILKIHITATY